MFQALGTHGPVFSPTTSLVLDVILLVAAFWLLATPSKKSLGDSLLLVTLVLAVSATRVLMQPLPNIQLVTVAALIIGAQLGARRGAAFAILVAMISNAFIGNGWWTIFQAIGWASVAVMGSKLSLIVNGELQRSRLFIAAIASAFVFDIIVSLSIIDSSFTIVTFLTYLAHGIPYDILHALGNLTFAVWFGSWFADVVAEDIVVEEIELTAAESIVQQS
jgi:energy-coupling factor transport system substrate-specific component